MANLNAALVIGPGVTLDGEGLLVETAACAVEPSRLTIDPQVMIIEETDRVSELALVTGIGSTGKGGGAAVAIRSRWRSP